MSSELISLNKEPYFDVFEERIKLIQQRDKIFNNILTGNLLPDNLPLNINSKIPKKIFQTWKTNLIHTPVLFTLQDLVKRSNPNYEYNLFDNVECSDFIKKNFDERVFDAYQRIIPGAFKADLWRYCVLYVYGGIYCDIDMVCLNSFDILLGDNIDMFVPIDLNQNPREGKHNLLNAFIGIIPKHPIMKNCIDIVVENVLQEKWFNSERLPLDFSGPGVLGRAVNRFLNREEYDSLIGLEGDFNNSKIKIKFFKVY